MSASTESLRRRRVRTTSSIVLVASVMGACGSDKEQTATQGICVLTEAVANALVGWAGGSLPQGLSGVCENLIDEWRDGGPGIRLQMQAGSQDVLDYYLPALATSSNSDAPFELRSLMEQMTAEVNAPTGSG